MVRVEEYDGRKLAGPCSRGEKLGRNSSSGKHLSVRKESGTKFTRKLFEGIKI